jgi:acyl dehydratase
MEKQLTIDSTFVNLPWKPAVKTITWRDTTNYAAGIGDMNPLYIDDERADGIMAPPMFAVTFGWPLTKDIQQYIDVPYTREILDRDVHFTEYIEFHKPLRPGGDARGIQITVQSEIHAMVPHRAGTNVVYKHTIMDENGEPYYVEYNGTLLRGVTCIDGGRGALPVTPETANQDEPLWTLPLHIPRSQLYIYDACSNIVNAIHPSPKFARHVGLPDIITTGSCTIAMGVREMVNRELAGEAAKLRILSAKRSAMILPDTTIAIELMERREGNGFVELFFRIVNADGQAAISKGYLRAAL